MAIILVDMDDVIADFEHALIDHLHNKHPRIPVVLYEERSTFYSIENYPEKHKSYVRDVTHAQGFYHSFKPLPGAIKAVKEMAKAGHTIFFCTSPLLTSEHCLQEKRTWIKEHLGQEWLTRLIITSDKTLVQGDILIDDKATITGAAKPVWTQILFTAPYNRQSQAKYRLSHWSNWEKVVEAALKARFKVRSVLDPCTLPFNKN